jgi:hypothetical protein
MLYDLLLAAGALAAVGAFFAARDMSSGPVKYIGRKRLDHGRSSADSGQPLSAGITAADPPPVSNSFRVISSSQLADSVDERIAATKLILLEFSADDLFSVVEAKDIVRRSTQSALVMGERYDPHDFIQDQQLVAQKIKQDEHEKRLLELERQMRDLNEQKLRESDMIRAHPDVPESSRFVN